MEPEPKIDMDRVVRRTAAAVAGQVADLGEQLGRMAEAYEVTAAKLAAAERTIAERDAALARAQAVTAQYERRIAELEERDGDTGAAPEGADGEA